MGSRRTVNHSLTGSGRPLNGSDVSGNSRLPGCSYLSNVRPENRSTLCSVIAQLTEETQPFFEVTLKSKAVSQSSSAKFTCAVTGHPTPQVTWYKDDIQLDRYCGLPKYEIFRNGPNHSLHIYHCTEEDAAIYQASATNTKGIVSCSGVLEVGEMNEFKIHQRYFSKLKQKAENKRKEAEEKENHEPTRTISPDRTQRKRRSTVGGYISAPSSTEDDTSDESQQEAAAGISEVSSRVQESSVEAFTYTNGTVESIEPRLSTDRDTKEDTPSIGTHDSAQKVVTGVPQTKTPLIKKSKINSAKASSEEKKVCEKEGNISMAGLETPESLIKSRNCMNSMEVESNTVSTSLKSLKRRVTSICGKQGINMEKGDCKASKVNVKVQNGHASNKCSPVIPPRTSKLQSPQLTIKKETSAIPKVIDRDKKARCLSPDMTSPPDTSCDTSTASPQPPCQQVRQEAPQKGTRPGQKSGGVPVSVQGMEATQPHAESQRNEAPVDLELQPKLQAAVAPETTTCKKTERDRRGTSLHHGFHKSMDNMTQDKQGHLMGSNKISLGLSPSMQKLPFKGPRTAENKSKCNVSPTAQQGQTKTPISTVGEEEIQHEQIKTSATAATSTGVLQLNGRTQHDESRFFLEEKNEEIAKTIEEMSGDLKKEEKHNSSDECVQVPLEGHCSLQPEEHTQVINKSDMLLKSEQKDLKKCPSPIPNIISIAELLRSQINALEESVSPQTAATNNSTGKGVEGESNCITTNKDPLTDQGPPQSIKETLLLIYNELIKTRDLFVDETPVLSNCTQPLNAAEIPSLIAPKVTIFSEMNDKATTGLSERASENNGYPLEEPEESMDTDAQRLTQGKHCPSLFVEETQTVTNETAKTNLECFPVVEVRETFSAPLISKTEELTSNMSHLEIVQELPAPSALESVDTNITIEDVETVMLSHLIPETCPGLEKRSDSIPAATPQELASGARRKVLSHKNKLEEPLPINNSSNPIAVSVPTSPQPSGHSVLLLPNVEAASPKIKRSPLLSKKKSPAADVPNPPTSELPNVKSEEGLANKVKNDPYRAPQVIRKIRGEPFADHCGNMKLWCQFFNVLCESTVTWFRDGRVIASNIKSAGDETQVNLALAQATCLDTGVYGCTISNEFGTDSTDFLLSAEVLRGMSLREDLGVGEEVELTPLIFNKGVADTCVWGNKLFGRIMVQESHLGVGFSHKTWRAKVIYGLEPVFESGNSCIIKVCNPIGYGGKSEGLLTQNNQEGVKQACQFQNLVREYCKIFSTEARGIDNFGSFLEVIPVYMLYRPANSIPYATVETDLTGVFNRYCGLDHTGKLDMRSASEVEQKCCALLHWIFQWTNGNMLFTKLEGVDFKITNIGISVKSHGHQGLPLVGNPKIFEQFVIQHQCNYYCGLLGLRSLKVIESLLMPTKPRGSKSPLLQRKLGSSSPQTGRKTSASPRTSKKKLQDGHRTPTEQSPADESKDKLSTSP
ncbi:unnamed protein product [Knipowitschia caucasica]